MRLRTFCRWGLLSISCLALLSVWSQTGRPQPAVVDLQPALRDDKPSPPPPDIKLPSVPPAPAAAPTPTVEDLIRRLEQLRKQKADLEGQEKVVITKLQERMRDQADRLNNLGIVPPAPPPAEAKDTVDAITPLLKNKGGRDEGKR